MSAATINGTAVNFGFHTTAGGATITTPTVFSGRILLQSATFSNGANRNTTMDEVGNVVVSAWTDPHQKATLEWVLKGSGLADTLTGSVMSTVAPGAFVTIAACAAMPDLVASTWEIVDEPKFSGDNTSPKKVSLSLEKRPGITAAASA